ncbi:MAG: hypothetical protein NZ518_04980 [Dehalococcoidia bacterium]|nr:hypothetical protein [Dehalococcoidia bacterium]
MARSTLRGRSSAAAKVAAAPVVAVIAIVVALVVAPPVAAHGRTLLTLADLVPIAPTSPLALITSPPGRATVTLQSPAGPVIMDLWQPDRAVARPAIILAMGVRSKPEDRPILFRFAETFARQGFVVAWPRHERLDQLATTIEHPATFLTAFEALAANPAVDPKRISFIGFSVGASIATVAAADPRIADRVRAVVFFGGYFDLLDFLWSVAAERYLVDGQLVVWNRDAGLDGFARDIALDIGAVAALPLLDTPDTVTPARLRPSLTAADRTILQRYNPADHVGNLRAPMFILHDRGDHFVPFVESERLAAALPPTTPRTLLVVDLFEHVQPGAVTLATARDLVALYGFLYAALAAFA